MSDRVDTEALAAELCAESEQHTSGVGRHDAARFGACSRHEQSAAEVLESSWLAARDARVRADAWDEGYVASTSDARWVEGTPNPYRGEGSL